MLTTWSFLRLSGHNDARERAVNAPARQGTLGRPSLSVIARGGMVIEGRCASVGLSLLTC
jgi:hypothetical protein